MTRESTLDVLRHDNHLLFVGKPAGLPIVPDESGDESLLDRAREWVRVTFAKPGAVYLGVVHRLDRPVSGVVLFARTSKAAARLSEAFRGRDVEKTYLGRTVGAPRGDEGTLEQWLVKDERTRRVHVARDADEPGAKRAVTHWRVLRRLEGGDALLELRPETGRAHQLRVACATLGTPLAGDLKYGAPSPLADASVALHAARLVVPHPTRDERVAVDLPPPSRPWWPAGVTV